MNIKYILLPLTAWSALALAAEPPVEEYAYGMHLDIAKVVSITEPFELYAPCRVVTAQMIYEDSAGAQHTLEYRRLSEVCSDVEGSG